MDSSNVLVIRDAPQASSDAITSKLLIVLLVLVLLIASTLGALWYLKRSRRSRNPDLPLHDNRKLAPKRSKHRRFSGITISATSLGHVVPQHKIIVNEKSEMVQTPASPVNGTLPQIRITFPEEIGDDGKAQSGREVVVHVGEQGNFGAEHVDEKLPPYTAAGERFVSVDLERIGGLREKHTLPQEARP